MQLISGQSVKGDTIRNGILPDSRVVEMPLAEQKSNQLLSVQQLIDKLGFEEPINILMFIIV